MCNLGIGLSDSRKMSCGSASWGSDHAHLLYLAPLPHCAASTATEGKCLSHYVRDALMLFFSKSFFVLNSSVK